MKHQDDSHCKVRTPNYIRIKRLSLTLQKLIFCQQKRAETAKLLYLNVVFRNQKLQKRSAINITFYTAIAFCIVTIKISKQWRPTFRALTICNSTKQCFMRIILKTLYEQVNLEIHLSYRLCSFTVGYAIVWTGQDNIVVFLAMSGEKWTNRKLLLRNFIFH